MPAPLTRRRFATLAAAALAAQRLRAQSAMANVAAIEHDRVLAEANKTTTPKTLIDFSANVAALTAAFVLTKEPAYAARAEALLTTWLITPPTRLSPQPAQAVVDLIPLAEVAVALRFLVDILHESVLTAVNTWFTDLQTFLNGDRTALLARDAKDHRASCWLLLNSAIARSQRDDKSLDQCRRLFRKPTLRNQITADGKFPQELASPYPYRNTLFNFDLLAGVCQLLASPFDHLWDFELQDGPGMRVVAALLYPLINDPAKWISVADAQHFREVPRRRPALLFTGRAYDRPEYVDLWCSLPLVVPTELAASFPIRQPLLWTTRAQHGF